MWTRTYNCMFQNLKYSFVRLKNALNMFARPTANTQLFWWQWKLHRAFKVYTINKLLCNRLMTLWINFRQPQFLFKTFFQVEDCDYLSLISLSRPGLSTAVIFRDSLILHQEQVSQYDIAAIPASARTLNPRNYILSSIGWLKYLK